MRPSHVILACLASIIWGLAFVFTKFGLDSFSAPQLAALRFLVVCPLVFFLPRPAISWSILVAIGLTLFTGQFLLLFFAYKQGMPPGPEWVGWGESTGPDSSEVTGWRSRGPAPCGG